MGIGSLNNSKRVGSVLGIDASTNSFAYCWYGAAGPIEWGEITFSGKTVWERLADGQAKVAALRESLDFDLIVFESAVFVQNKKTVVLLAYSFGALVASIMQDGRAVEEIPPVTWQHAISNKPLTKQEKEQLKLDYPNKTASWYSNKSREIRKQRTMDWVKNNFNIDVKSDNISDAIAISHVGYEKFKS
jgi:Holliday junction resolvasome RuvABC endonuclease subunit